jgi:hypothetical protein
MSRFKEKLNDTQTYLVQEQPEGVYVTDQTTRQRFFRTKSGGWFWLIGPANPFGEDVQLGDQEKAYLDEIVEEAGY